MGKRKPLTVKQQAAQLRIIEEKAVNASLRRLRLNVAKLRLKGKLEKPPSGFPKAAKKKDRHSEDELRQIAAFVQVGNVEKLQPGSGISRR